MIEIPIFLPTIKTPQIFPKAFVQSLTSKICWYVYGV